MKNPLLSLSLLLSALFTSACGDECVNSQDCVTKMGACYTCSIDKKCVLKDEPGQCLATADLGTFPVTYLDGSMDLGFFFPDAMPNTMTDAGQMSMSDSGPADMGGMTMGDSGPMEAGTDAGQMMPEVGVMTDMGPADMGAVVRQNLCVTPADARYFQSNQVREPLGVCLPACSQNDATCRNCLNVQSRLMLSTDCTDCLVEYLVCLRRECGATNQCGGPQGFEAPGCFNCRRSQTRCYGNANACTGQPSLP